MEVKFIKSKILVVCTLLILLVSLSTVVASEVNDVVTSTDDGNLTVQSTTNDMEIEQSNNDILNDEQSSESDMLLASSDEKSYNDDGQDDVLMASANEDVLGEGSFSQLNDLITGSGNNLTLTDDYKNNDGTITINKNNWVLDGQGHVIDGNNNKYYNIFKLNDANNITFKNIKFQNVDYQGSGGVIQFDNNSPGYISKEVTFENCTFTNCKARTGGVMAINKGIWNITIKNCVFDKYQAEFKGGAFYAENLQNKISCLNIYNSTFSNGNVTNNRDSANGGGAIFLYASCTGNIYSTKFINHTIKDHLHEGMAIRYSGVLNIDGCEFENNKGWDGAVCTGSDTSSATIKNSIFKNNHASRWGGALQIRNALIENCTFINNTAQNGGAIYSRFTIYIKDSKFEDNAATDGGAVNIEKRTTGSVIEGCNFTNNTASRGGAIFSDHAASNQIFSSKFNENKATSLGGAIYLDNEHPGTMEITTSEFVNNDAPAGGAIYDTGNLLKITSSKFVNNTANTTFAGAIYSNDLTIKTSDFIENTAKTYAGAVYAVNSLNIDESNFKKNYADAAGAVFTSYISATYTNFIENHARIAGAVEIDGSSTRTSTISDSEFRDNNATENAGALYWNAAEAIITSTKFISNYAGNDAGAIFWNKGKGIVTRSEFKNNTALGSGGAIYWNSADGTVSSTTFEDNYAKYRGGAIYWHGNSGTVQTSTFKRNSADAEGSVIYWYGNNGLVSGSTFSENPTLLGAVYHHGSNGKIIGNTFNQDKAVYICGHSSATIENNKQNSLNLENYSISTQGNISLINNEFTNAIHNYGNILTDTTVIVLDNKTIITDAKTYDIYTAVLDDNGNYIKLGNDLVNLYENTQQFTAAFNNTHYVFESPYLNLGTHPVTAIGNFTGLQRNVVKSGVLMYMILDINVTVVNYGEEVIITTTVVNTTENGTITLVINEQVYDDIPLVNGTAVFVLHNAPPATYFIDAYYGVFNQTIDANVTCVIEARNSTLIVTANNITAGQDLLINISVTNGTTGTVHVFVNNNMYILTLTNSTAQLNLTNLPGGIYNIFATYYGDHIFKPSYNNTLVNVSKMDVVLPIIVRNNILVGETVVVNINSSSDLTGTFRVYVNGDEYIYTRSPISFTLTNVSAGNYTVRVIYSGDGKYNAANNNTTFIVSKKNFVPTLTVEDIEVGDNETIIVHVPTNANGIIFLTVNGVNYYDYGKDGKATFVLSDLPQGKYNVTAIYLEDNTFYSSRTNATFMVDYVIIDPTITYTVDEDLDVTVNVTVPADANGDIIIEVNGTNYTAHIVKGKFSVDIPGLEGGIYPAKMYFANDTKYQAVNKTFEIQLKKIDAQIHVNAPYIYVGENATITVTVPGDAGGNVTINVYNANYNETFTRDVINGTAIFTIPGLVYGTYDVKAVFSGDRKYNGDDENARFNVRKVDPNPYSYLVAEDIFVGETATFNITMPTDITAKVNLTIQGQVYTVNVTNGFGQINITGLKAGSPVPVTAYFAGNEKYLDCERNYTAFNVHKITNYPVDISAVTNSSIADNMTANITVKIAEDANGTGYITINNKTYNITYTNGIANILVDNLTSGRNYTVHAHFNGNDKYSPGDATKTLGGNKTLDYIFNVTADDVFVGNPVYLIIYLPNATAGDFITVVVPHGEYAKGIKTSLPSDFNGTFSFPVYNLAAGTYENCSVTYHGNAKYEESTRYGIISVSKINVSPKINYNTTYVGQNLTVQITLNPDSNGTVSIDINNNKYNATVVNGTAYVVIPNLEAKTYNATLSYSGNEKYNPRNQHFDVRILRIYDYVFELGVVDIFVGDNETITIHLPSDMDVNVTVNIPGTDYTNRSVQLTQGNATIRIPGLSAGTYAVTASITNSSRYLDNSFTRTFTVSPKDDYYFKLDNVTTVFVRDNITFVLRLPDDASGNATVHIFGEDFTGEVNDGVATIHVKTTQEGNFPFTISFEEEGKYNYKSQSGYAFVTKKELNLTPIYNGTVEVDEDVIFYFNSLDDATGNITITSRGVPYTAPIINGTAKIVLKGYPLASVYSPAISYTGDDKYYSSRGVVNINVVKVSDYEINVTVANITVDDTEIVNITIPSDATEDVLISGNFSDSTISVKVTNGNATFSIPNLAAGTYFINVRYQGYQKYSDKNVTKIFEVRKVVPPIEIDFVNNNTIIVKLPDLANGYANVTVGENTTQIKIVNGRGSLDVSYLRPETYTVTATFLGGARYLENTTSRQITIPKIEDYILPVSAEDIIVGENSTITVILPEYAEGTVNITIDDGDIIPVEIIEGEAIYTATNMGVGTHNVTVSYADDEYVFKTNSTRFTVYKIKTIIDLTVDGNSTNITVTARLTENVTGNVTIVIDSVEYPFYDIASNVIVLTVGAVPKEHDISVIYSGDENHTDASATTYIETIKESDYSINVTAIKLITVRDNNIITVQLPVGAIGNVHIYINGQPYMVPANPETGIVNLTLPTLASGNYNVTAVFSNTYYAEKENSTNFTVIKLNTTIVANVTNITKDLDEIINITLNESTSGDVEITIDGRTYLASIDEGFATLTLSNLNDGNYTAIITYKGDNLFNGNSTTVHFTVSKIPLNITITGPECIIVGQQADFIIETTQNITDMVTVKIGDKNYTAIVYNGKGNLIVTDLNDIGNYNVTVIYAGDNYYLPATNATKINVSGKLPTTITVDVTKDNVVGEPVTIYINVTGDVNGTVYITLSGNPVPVKLENGTGNHTYYNLTARDYHFTVIYLESEYYLAKNATGDFTVSKKQSPISANVTNATVGSVELINVNLPTGANGTVLLTINGSNYYSLLKDGLAQFNVTGLPVGNHTAYITYEGNDYYLSNQTEVNITTTKLTLTINITSESVIVVNNPVSFTIETSENITEVVMVKIINKDTQQEISNERTFVENGKGSFIVYGLAAGNYTAIVTFPGNTQYGSANNETNFTISGKSPTSLNVSVENITLGENAIVYVNVTGALTGKVTLNIAGNPQTKEVVDGKVNFTVSGLIARDYHVTVTYLENDNYLESTASTDFTVFRKDSPISASVTNATVGSIEYINVYLPQNATGTVLLTINGSNYYSVVDGGVAKFNVTGLLVGNHTAYIKYEGDSDYLGNETKVNITTTKLSTTIKITTDEVIVEGHPVVFTIETGAPLTEVITIKIGSDVYTTFVENGKGTYTVNDLAVGHQTAHVYFAGNTQYDKVENHTDFTIRGKSPSNITVKVDSITVDDVAVIYVNVTEGANGKVNVIVAGVSHEIILNNSRGNLTLPGLSAREYHVTAYYNGDDYYSNSTGTADFTVSKIPTSIRFEVSDINVGQKAVIKVILNETTDENITVHVNGVKYILNDYETTFEVPNLPEGTVVVTAEYVGNDRLTRAFNETTFKVTKNTTAIKIISHNITAGQKEIIELHLASDIDGVAEVTVGNVSYAAVIKNGIAKLELENLASGNYNVTVLFYGNDKYLSSTANSSFTVSHESNFIFTANATVDSEANVVIGITLPDDVSGEVKVEIDGKNYTGLVVNGKGSATIVNLPGKEYVGTVYFDGNDKYEASTTTVEFTITKVPSNMRLEYSTIYVGDDAVITVYLPDAATGNVTISINNKTEKVVNGTATFIIPGLEHGIYPFEVNYTGDGRYLSAQRSGELVVNVLTNHTLVVTAEDIHVGDNATIYVTLPEDATGNVTILIDNRTFNTGELVNGKGNVTVPGLKHGTYEIFAEYVGDAKYGYIKDTAHMSVRKIENYPFNVTITNNTSVGENATITVTLPKDVTNKVNITVDGVTKEVVVVNGTANLTVNVTSGGSHPVVVTYPGDDKYESAIIYTDLSNNKITGFPFSVKGDTIEVGQIAYVWFYDLPSGAWTNASVKISVSTRQEFNMLVNKSSGYAIFHELPIGVYDVTVTYSGNEQYASTVRYTTITVTKVSDYPMDVTVNEPNVGENLTIEIKLPGDAGGVVNVTLVTVELGNRTYNVTVINGTANLTIPTDDLPDGDYNATVYYTGDDKYEEMTKIIPVDIVKVQNYIFDIESFDIYVGQNETITIELPEDVNAVLNITIGNDNYEIIIVNGTGSRNITGLAYGSYEAEVTFGNAKYDKRTRHTSFKVSKISDYEWNMTYDNSIKVGQNATIEVNVPVDATGNVTLMINNQTFTGEIKQGKAFVNATGLPEGSYQFTLHFEDGSGKYASSSKVGLVVVSKTDIELNPVYKNITVGDVAEINVTLPAGAQGDLTLFIDGRTFSQPIAADGKVTFHVPDLDADNHTFIIGFDGDDKYNGDVYTGVIEVVKNGDYKWDFDVADIKVGQDEIINITLPDDATGGLIITVGNVSYHKAANGNTTYVVSGLDNGTYTVTIQYQGNLKYSNKTITKEFNVTKNNAPISIDVIDNVVIVSLPDDATGEVNITIGNKTELVPVIKGKATLDISDMLPNDYIINAIYDGDRKYFANKTGMPINIPKVDEYDMTVKVDNITVGGNATVTVTLPKDATGYVNITVDNETKEVEIINGTATLEVPNLGIGDHNVFVNYTGNVKYNNNTASGSFNVKGQDVTPEVIVEGNNTVIVKLPENANGEVNITIGNETQKVKVINGTAVWNGTALEPGDYDVKVEYSGDDTYAPANATVGINIRKLASAVDLNVSDIMEGSIEVITVEVTPGATGTVIITIGDEGYSRTLDKGKATFNIAGLSHGLHEAVVTYLGDDKYLNSSASKPFYVGQKEVPSIIITADSSIEIDNTLKFTVTTNSTSTNITVKVNGVEVELVDGKYVYVANVSGEFNITAVVAENINFTSASDSAKFTVYKHAAEIVSIDVPENTIITGANAQIKVTLANNESGNVLIEIAGLNYTVPINGKVATLDVVLPAGDYAAKVFYLGDAKYNSTSGESAGFTVSAPMIITVGENDGNSTPITIKVPGNASGNVTVLVNGTPYTAKVENGTATVNVVNATPGKQDITVNFTEDGKKPVVQNATVDIPKVNNYPISAEVVNQTGGNATIVVTVPEDATGNVTVTVNNKTYPAEVKDGKAIVNVSDLPVGSHSVDVTYEGDDKYNSLSTKTHIDRPVDIPTINAVDLLVRGWNSIYDYEAVFLDKFGNALEGVNVTFTINGKTYTVLTEKHGVAKLTTSQLNVGQYNVTSYNPVTGETVTKGLKVVPRLIQNKDITMDFMDGTYYTVLVIGDDGNPVGEGEIIDIYVNTIHYVSKTDKNGIARLKINLNPSKYKVIAEYKNYNVTNKLVVKQTLKLVKKTVTAKKGKKITLKAKLKWSNGKAIKGKVIKFKFKGKFYKAKTNKKGVAKVVIKKKSVLKKLKKGKKYTFVASYIKNKVKGKVKIKK